MALSNHSEPKRLSLSGDAQAVEWGVAARTASEQVPPLQRDLLLCEAHHRIKNSLQLVASVLRRQAGESPGSQSPHEALMQASRRVQTIARMHDNLQVSGRCDVALAPYLRQLCADLSHSLASPDPGPVMVEADEVTLPGAWAAALGLIVNELVTNALKHAWQGDIRAPVRVVTSVSPDGTLRLVVADSGPGLPDDVELGARRGLGVDGVPPGTRFTLRLPLQAGGLSAPGDA